MSARAFVPALWSGQILEAYETRHVYRTCCNKNYQGEIKREGDTVQILTPGDITIFTITADTNITAAENPKGGGQSLTISQWKGFNFLVPNVDEVQSKPAIMRPLTNRAGWRMAQVVDTYIAGELDDYVATDNTLNSAATPYVIGNGSGYTDLYDLLVDFDVKLSENDVPEDGRWVILPPSAYGVLRKDDRFIDYGTEKNRAAMRGEDLGEVANLRIKKSNNVVSTGSGASKVWTIVGGHTDAVTFAEQIVDVEAYRPELRVNTDALKGQSLYGMKVTRPNALVMAYVNVAPTV